MTTAALPINPIAALWQNLHSRVLFKFVLPLMQHAELEGIKLDISKLSPLMKNHIRTGRYEVQERRLAQQSLTNDDIILELGGAIGFIGLYCRKVIGVKHHLSVEANPHTLEQLKRNYALNGLAPQVIHAAAAAEDGEIMLNVGGEFWENSIVTKDHSKSITVPALSLSSLIAMMPASPTALVCDIEGAEQHLDFTQLPRSVKKIIIELHPEIIGRRREAQILARLYTMGFKERVRDAGTWLLERS
jgi:FkbM family methyltransferase